MPSVLIVDEIAADRKELSRALEAEGFHVVESESADAAVRDIWEGSFIVAFVASVLAGTSGSVLAEQLQDLAPEIETFTYNKNDEPARLVRKAIAVRDGVAAA